MNWLTYSAGYIYVRNKMVNNTEQKGIPIYFDPTDRSMVNAMDEPNIDIDAWYPSIIQQLKSYGAAWSLC